MARKMSVYVESAKAFREIRLNARGEPVFASNGAQIGTGIRTIDVVDAPDQPPPDPDPEPAPQPDPLPGDMPDLEFNIMADGTIEGIQNRLIPYPYPQAGVFPRMLDMVVGGTTYTFSETVVDATTALNHVFTSGIYTITIGFWGFVQVSYDSADAALLPAQDQEITILTITSHRWALQDGSRPSQPKATKAIKIRGDAVVIDTVAPTVSSVSPSGTGVSLGAPIVITFSEQIVAGSGNFQIRDTVAGATFETIPVANAIIVGTQATITPTVTQEFSNGYSIRFDAGVVQDLSGNAVAALAADTYSWTTTDAPADAGAWYDQVFAYHDGTGVGPRVSSFTPAATWAAATSGVSNNGTTITVSGSGITATGIDFTGFKLFNTGANNIFEDCIGDVNANGAGGNNSQWRISGLNPTVRYCRITNPSRRGGIIQLAFNDATGTITAHHNDLRDWAGQDPLKGPGAGVTLNSYDNLFLGCHLTTNAHIDGLDFRLSAPGSYIKRTAVIGNKTAESVPSSPGTGFNNATRQSPGDFSGAGGIGLIVEECIFVGHDDPAAQGAFLSIGNGGTAGNVMYDVLVDLRFHPNLVHTSARWDDWYVRNFDYAASVAAGQVVGISAPVPYPLIATQPAQIPATMSAPVITAAPGEIQWADNPRPLNYRSLITQYDLRHSTDGTNWTVVNDVSRTAGSISVAPGSNYRVEFRAVNGVGAGAWSASSNQVNVAAPSGTHRIGLLEGQSELERVLNDDAVGAPAKPTLLADNRVKFVYHRPGPDPRPLISKWLVASDTSLSGAMIAFANMLISAGGALDTWEIGWIVREGRGWSVLMSNTSDWPFARAQEIVSNLSGPPTVQFQSWASANRTLGNSYARGFENLWLATDNGTPITAPWNVKNNAGTGTAFTAQNLMADLLDPDTCIPVLGLHKFDVRQDNDSYSTPAGGAFDTDFTSRDIHRNRNSIENFFDGANVGPSVRGPDIVSYLNGYASGTGWADLAHPGSKDADGVQRFGMYLAYAIANAFGVSPDQPEITSVTWTPQKVTISTSAGALTNVFAHRSESQLNPATFSHYTDAIGFYINGQPAERAEFVGGNIELYYGDGTQNFINTDTIMFLPGGGGATLKVPEDWQNAVWKAIPHVDIGLPIVDLMNLRPLVNFNAKFPNTLVNTTR